MSRAGGWGAQKHLAGVCLTKRGLALAQTSGAGAPRDHIHPTPSSAMPNPDTHVLGALSQGRFRRGALDPAPTQENMLNERSNVLDVPPPWGDVSSTSSNLGRVVRREEDGPTWVERWAMLTTCLGQVRPKWAKVGLESSNSGPASTELLGRTRRTLPTLARCWPSVAKFGRVGPKLGQRVAKIGPESGNVDQLRADIDRCGTKLYRSRTSAARKPVSDEFGKLNLGPPRPPVDQSWGRVRPHVGSKSAKFGQRWPGIGELWPMLDRPASSSRGRPGLRLARQLDSQRPRRADLGLKNNGSM